MIKSKFTLLIAILLFSACKTKEPGLEKVETARIAIDEKLESDPKIDSFIAPYKNHIQSVLDSAIAYNPAFLSKTDGELNTAIGNFMADAIMEQAAPIFKKRTGKSIDFVLLNHGGIRADIAEGAITTRTAYNIMPFENEIVVAELSGEKVLEMLKYLEKAKTAHPVSGISLVADGEYRIIDARVNGEQISEDKNYFVCTSDYLQQGGDNMTFLKDPENLYFIDYKMRNAFIDYFSRIDTLKTKADNRYIKQ